MVSAAYLLAVESSRQYPDAVHLAPILPTEVEPPVERHDGSDLFGGCARGGGKARIIIPDLLVVGVLTSCNRSLGRCTRFIGSRKG